MSEREVLLQTTTPDGVAVVCFADTWNEHILGPGGGHGELGSYLEAVMTVVAALDHREPDRRPDRERFFKRDVGPSRWLMAVVDFNDLPARIVTALGYGHGRSPQGWIP